MTEMALPSRLTLAEATAAAQQLSSRAQSDAAREPMPLVLDARGLEAFDSSAFAVMLEVARKATSGGQNVTVRGAPQSMIELAKLYGINELLAFTPA
jgi:phospholipid transport system transporter-binding protein